MAGVAQGESRRRLCKRIRRMKPAGDGTKGQCGGPLEDRLCGRQCEHSKTNGPELFSWQELLMENTGGGFAKILGK